MTSSEYINMLQILANSNDPRVRSDAYTQLGIIQQSQQIDNQRKNEDSKLAKLKEVEK